MFHLCVYEVFRCIMIRKLSMSHFECTDGSIARKKIGFPFQGRVMRQLREITLRIKDLINQERISLREFLICAFLSFFCLILFIISSVWIGGYFSLVCFVFIGLLSHMGKNPSLSRNIYWKISQILWIITYICLWNILMKNVVFVYIFYFVKMKVINKFNWKEWYNKPHFCT